jgi:hypothetical protein
MINTLELSTTTTTLFSNRYLNICHNCCRSTEKVMMQQDVNLKYEKARQGKTIQREIRTEQREGKTCKTKLSKARQGKEEG